jgi:hypothetical protein
LKFSFGNTPGRNGKVDAWLYGFDSKAVFLDVLGSAVGTWTTGDSPRVIALCPPSRRPFRGPAPVGVRRSSVTFTRRRFGGGVISRYPEDAPEVMHLSP